MVNDDQLIINGEEPCNPCDEAVNDAFASAEEHLLTLPEFDEDNEGPFYVLEYILDARDIIIEAILIGIVTLGEPFVPYLGQATVKAIGAFAQSLFGGDHLITAIAKTILALAEFFIEVCEELLEGGGTNTQSAPASTQTTSAASATSATTTAASTQTIAKSTSMVHSGTMSL